MSLGQKITKVGKLSFVYAVGGLIPQVFGILLWPVFTRYLPPEQMGIVNLAARVMGPMAILVQMGVLSSVKSLYFRTDKMFRPQLVKTVFLGQALQGIGLCTLLSVAGIWLAPYFLPNLPLSPSLVYLLWLMVVWSCCMQTMIRLTMNQMQFNENALKCVSINLTTYFLQLGLGLIAVVVLGWRGFGRQGTVFMATSATVVLCLWMIRPFMGGRFDLATYGRVLRKGLTFVPHSLSGVLSSSVNAWLVNSMISTAALGVYGIALHLAQLVMLPVSFIGQAVYPTMANLMNEGTPEAKRQQTRLYTLLIGGVAAMCLGLALFSSVAIDILVAPKYHASKGVVPILVLAFGLQGLYWVLSNSVFYVGGGLWLALASASFLAATVVFSLALIPLFGIYGAAYAMVLAAVVLVVVIYLIAQRVYPLPWRYGPILGMIAGVGALGTVDYLFVTGLPVLVALPVKFLLWLAFLPVMLAVRAIHFRELKTGLSLARKFIHNRFGKAGTGPRAG